MTTLPTTGSRLYLRRRTGRPVALTVVEIVVDRYAVAHDDPHRAGCYISTLVIDLTTAETIKDRVTYRPAAGTSVYGTFHAATDEATHLAA